MLSVASQILDNTGLIRLLVFCPCFISDVGKFFHALNVLLFYLKTTNGLFYFYLLLSRALAASIPASICLRSDV